MASTSTAASTCNNNPEPMPSTAHAGAGGILFTLCFSAYFFVMLKILVNFAIADRIAEAPVWGLEGRGL